MANQTTKIITLPKSAIRKEGMVILPLAEYEKIRKKIEKLKKEKKLSVEEAEILKIIAEGEKEYKEGRLKPIKSLAELD